MGKAFKFTKQQLEDFRLVDKYLTNEQESELLGICNNTLIKIRSRYELPVREKGRPKTVCFFQDEIPYPEEVISAINRLNHKNRAKERME